MSSDSTRESDSVPKPRPGRSRSPLRFLGFWLCVLLGALAGNALMPQPASEDGHWQSVSEDGIRRFLRNAPPDRATEIGKNHETVKSAFRDVVRPVISSTVRVLVEGRQVALGVVVDRQGHILTKASEVDEPVRCKLGNGESFPADVIGVDRKLDLALLRSSRTDLTPITFASEVPQIGSWLAVPDNRGDAPLLVGTISALSREIKKDDGFLGVVLEPAANGSRIGHVLPESSAAKFGLREGDIIYAVDGRQIRDHFSLIEIVQGFRPGDDVEFGIMRDGKKSNRRITLTRRGEVAAAEDGSIQHDGGPLSTRRSGFPQVLQHDCTLRPNQCGGPLVNLDGHVVGINIARAGRVESYAIPAYLIQGSLPRLVARSN